MLLYEPNAVLGIRSRSHFFYQCRADPILTYDCQMLIWFLVRYLIATVTQNLVSKHETNKMISILDFEQNLILNLHCGALLLCFLQKLTLLDTTHETQGVTKTYL